MSIKKLIFGLAALALLFSFSGSVSAQTVDINALLQQIALIQSQIAALSGAPATGDSGSCAFTKDLTIGSSGSEVTCLQNALIGQGYSIPAGATGYFGNQTKSAVMAWQGDAGVSPASGYFGSRSRAAWSATAFVPPPPPPPPPPAPELCPNGMTLASNCTLSPAPVIPAADLCPNGNTLVSNCTLAPGAAPEPLCPNGKTIASNCVTSPGTTVVPSGTEGSITTKLAVAPVANSNIRTTTDVSVYGVEFEAVNSDMTVDRADLQFTVSTWGSTSAAGTLSVVNPGNFINTIKAWDGSTLLGSWSINSTSFSKDSSDRYHIILSGLNSKVTKGTKKNITFSVSVNAIGSTDVPRRVAIQGYAGNTQNMRATDSIGLQSYADMSGSANTRTHDFKAAGASTLTVSINTALTPKAANHKVSTTDGVLKLIMQAFDAKSESGDSKITKVYATVNATSTTAGAYPSTLYLCASNPCESSPLGSVAGATTDGGQSIFTSLSILVPQDTTKTFYFAADFPTTANGQMASTSIGTNYVQWEKPDGATASTTPSSEIAGNDHYFDSAVPQWTIAAPGTISVTTPTYSGAASSTISGSLTFKVKAVGGALTKPVIADFGLGFASSTQTTYTDAQLLGVGESGFTAVIESIDPSDATVGDGNEYTIKVKATQLAGTAAGVVIIPAAANYKLVATSTKAVVGGNTITQTWNTATWESPFGFFTSN